MMKTSARPSLYTPEAAEGRGTHGIAITSLAEVGGGRSTGVAWPLTWHRLRNRRLGASTGATEKTHRDKVAARRARQNIRQTRADTRRVRGDASKTHI
jgi:hypothetical protein